MAVFLYHTECSACGSSDANAIYDDNSTFCFSCRKLGRVSKLLQTIPSSYEKGNHREMVLLDPGELTTHFSSGAVNWFLKYGLDIPTILHYNVLFNYKRNAVVFRWLDDNGKVILYQSRGMEKKRFFTSSNHGDVLPLYYSHSAHAPADTCVVVEDCVSAIKIALVSAEIGPPVDSMPLLGSHLPNSKLTALKRIYSRIIFWLDHDKGKEAIQYSTKAQMLGLESHVLQTLEDPKKYTYTEINEKLR